MPDGEIFTSPVDDSAEGQIYFEFPGVYAGMLIKGIRLEFSKGVVTKATAEENEDLLQRIIETDEGSKTTGRIWRGDQFRY